MTTQNTDTADSSWTVFIEILSDEFTAKTGFGVYASRLLMSIRLSSNTNSAMHRCGYSSVNMSGTMSNAICSQ